MKDFVYVAVCIVAVVLMLFLPNCWQSGFLVGIAFARLIDYFDKRW